MGSQRAAGQIRSPWQRRRRPFAHPRPPLRPRSRTTTTTTRPPPPLAQPPSDPLPFCSTPPNHDGTPHQAQRLAGPDQDRRPCLLSFACAARCSQLNLADSTTSPPLPHCPAAATRSVHPRPPASVPPPRPVALSPCSPRPSRSRATRRRRRSRTARSSGARPSRTTCSRSSTSPARAGRRPRSSRSPTSSSTRPRLSSTTRPACLRVRAPTVPTAGSLRHRTPAVDLDARRSPRPTTDTAPVRPPTPGMKAYKPEGGEPALFRPEMNMARMNRSAARIGLPVRPSPSPPCARHHPAH